MTEGFKREEEEEEEEGRSVNRFLEDVNTERVEISNIETKDTCSGCFKIIAVGEKALEIVKENENWRLLNKQEQKKSRWRRIAIFYDKCAPQKKKPQKEKHIDILDSRIMLPGSFGHKKRR